LINESKLSNSKDSEKQRQPSDATFSKNSKPEVDTVGIKDMALTVQTFRAVENQEQSCSQIRRKRRQDWCRWPVCGHFRATGHCAAEEDPIYPSCLRAHIGPNESAPITPEGEVRVCFDSLGLMDLQCTRPDCHFYHPPKEIRDQIVARRHAQYLRDKVFKTTADVTHGGKHFNASSLTSESTAGYSTNTQWPLLPGQGPGQLTLPTSKAFAQTNMQSNSNEPSTSLMCGYLGDPTLNTTPYRFFTDHLFAPKPQCLLPNEQPVERNSLKSHSINPVISPSPAAVALLTGTPTSMASSAQVISTRSDVGNDWGKLPDLSWMQLLSLLQTMPINGIRPLSGIPSLFDSALISPVTYKAPVSIQPCAALPSDHSLWTRALSICPGMNQFNQISRQLITGSHLPMTGLFPSTLSSAPPAPSTTSNIPINGLSTPEDPSFNQITFGQTSLPIVPLPISFPFPLTNFLNSPVTTLSLNPQTPNP
ncbi:hypothetical protein FBUS_09482, partial [Fasciolopsis buskii]